MGERRLGVFEGVREERELFVGKLDFGGAEVFLEVFG
jgi:hypothetical protein